MCGEVLWRGCSVCIMKCGGVLGGSVALGLRLIASWGNIQGD